MNIQPFNWPTKKDYDIAIESITENVNDPNLQKGTVRADATGMLRFGGAGLYTTLYHIDNMMIRCFCRTEQQREPPHDIVERYQHISAFTHSMQHVPNLVPITLVENGIQVMRLNHDTDELLGTEVVPFVKMPFIYGQSLGSFTFANLGKRERMEKLCTAWLQLIVNLDSIEMAHGDLDLTNVIVTEDRDGDLVLKLIDYDNTWIPQLDGYEQTEGGHDHFQHPAFNSKQPRLFNAQMDRFSALVIYISLRAVTHSPNLYTELGADEANRLILDRADYVAEMNGLPNRIELLRNKQIPQLEPLLDELCSCLRKKSMPRCLKDLVHSGPTESLPIYTPLSGNTTEKIDGDPSRNGKPLEAVYDDWERVQWRREGPNLTPVGPQVYKLLDTVPAQPKGLGPGIPLSNRSGASQRLRVPSMSDRSGYPVEKRVLRPPSRRRSQFGAVEITLIVSGTLIVLAILVLILLHFVAQRI